MPSCGHYRRGHAIRIAAVILALSSLLALTGCWIFSIRPLLDGPSDPDLIFDQNLVGAWSLSRVAENCQWTLTIEASSRAYNFTMAPGTGCKSAEKTTHYLGYLIKLDNHRFLDVEPKTEDMCDLCVAAHTFVMVSLKDGNLALTPLDGDWVFKAINDKRVVLDHVGGDGEYIDMTLTARPPELKDFLRKYADDKDAFKTSASLVFARK
ncbi:MAG: hypothetical protein ABSE44_04695 [Candidatus Sulfotelmatobacter sp.]|jgi:hypothetical protein